MLSWLNKFSYLKNCELVHEFQTQKIIHTNLLYTARPPRVPSPLPPRADVQGSGVRKKRFECIMLSNPSDLPTPYPPVYPLPYPQSRGTEVSTR